MKVAVQGELGCYSHAAAKHFFSSTQLDIVPCESSTQVVDKVSQGEVDAAVIPVENSISGLFPQVYESLAKHANLHIQGEFSFHETHCLVALPGVKLEQVKKVLSHPSVLDQCEKFLAQRGFSSKKCLTSYDTAGSCVIIKEQNLTDTAALASKDAAEMYGLQVLQAGCEDSKSTATRYVVVTSETKAQEVSKLANYGQWKTTLIFSLKNTTGSLMRAIACFSLRDIAISKIESRPSSRCGSPSDVSRPWEYSNIMDIEGSIKEERIKKALANLEEFATTVRVLGSFRQVKPGGFEPSPIHGCT